MALGCLCMFLEIIEFSQSMQNHVAVQGVHGAGRLMDPVWGLSQVGRGCHRGCRSLTTLPVAPAFCPLSVHQMQPPMTIGCSADTITLSIHMLTHLSVPMKPRLETAL